MQVFDPSGKFLFAWGRKGTGDGEFNIVGFLAFDSQGNVYVTDVANHRVQKFNPNGEFLAKWGSAGSGDGQFQASVGIAFDSQGNVYICDVLNSRIQKFDPNGRFLAKWGSKGEGDGQFRFVSILAIDALDRVYAVDESFRVQQFDATGKVLGQWQMPPGVDGGRQRAVQMAIDAQGQFYVGHGTSFPTTISVFRPRQAPAGGGTTSPVEFVRKLDTGAHPLRAPAGLAVDRQGNLYVADEQANVVQRYDAQGRFVA